MQKIILGFLTAFLTLNSLNADNKPMSDDEFMKQFLSSKKTLEISEEKAKKQRTRTQELERITKALKKVKNKKTTK